MNVDYTNLNLDASEGDIRKLCAEAIQYNFFAVCVYPKWISVCKRVLRSTSVKICTVIGFPTGLESTEEKCRQAKEAVANGADEIDMVINIVNVLADKRKAIINDIYNVRQSVPGMLKVIIETNLLTDQQKIIACKLAYQAEADFIKTNTGKTDGSYATISDIKLIKSIVGVTMGIKASGGIKTKEQAGDLIAAGATRIGTSKILI